MAFTPQSFTDTRPEVGGAVLAQFPLTQYPTGTLELWMGLPNAILVAVWTRALRC